MTRPYPVCAENENATLFDLVTFQRKGYLNNR